MKIMKPVLGMLLVCVVILALGIRNSEIIRMIQWEHERIGVEFVYIPYTYTNDSHGTISGARESEDDTRWTLSFLEMDSTAHWSVENPGTLRVTSMFSDGEVTLKITQGTGLRIQKIPLYSGVEIRVDVSDWAAGKLEVWLVVEDCIDGMITVQTEQEALT